MDITLSALLLQYSPPTTIQWTPLERLEVKRAAVARDGYGLALTGHVVMPALSPSSLSLLVDGSPSFFLAAHKRVDGFQCMDMLVCCQLPHHQPTIEISVRVLEKQEGGGAETGGTRRHVAFSKPRRP